MSVHPASLVSHTQHDKQLLNVVAANLNRAVVAHVVDTIANAVEYGLGRSGVRPSSSSSSGSSSSASSSASSSPTTSPASSSSSSPTRGRTTTQTTPPSPSSATPTRAEFAQFVASVLRRAEVQMPVVLTTLVYISRATPHLRIAIEEYAFHRVFLGALIVASKYTNDSSLKNAHWAIATNLFGKRDIGRVEREFLEVLDFELAVRESEVQAVSEQVAKLVGLGIVKAQPKPLESTMQVRNHTRSHHLRRPTPYSLPAPVAPVPTSRRERDESQSPSSGSDWSSGSSASDPASPRTPPSHQHHHHHRHHPMHIPQQKQKQQIDPTYALPPPPSSTSSSSSTSPASEKGVTPPPPYPTSQPALGLLRSHSASHPTFSAPAQVQVQAYHHSHHPIRHSQSMAMDVDFDIPRPVAIAV